MGRPLRGCRCFPRPKSFCDGRRNIKSNTEIKKLGDSPRWISGNRIRITDEGGETCFGEQGFWGPNSGGTPVQHLQSISGAQGWGEAGQGGGTESAGGGDTCERGGAWRGVPASPCARPGAKPREDPGQVQLLVNALHTIPILPAMLKIKPPFLRFKDGKTFLGKQGRLLKIGSQHRFVWLPGMCRSHHHLLPPETAEGPG